MKKSPGPDSIVNEVINYCSPVTIKCYTKLYNLVLDSGYSPETWQYSLLVPIFKSGDSKDPNNYRGISLINAIAKIFSSILNNRIIKYMENKFSQEQFGFLPKLRTTDSLFVFKTLINKYLNLKKKPLFICFVDLRKAFDPIWRTALLYKILSQGIGSKMYQVIKNMYSTTNLQ